MGAGTPLMLTLAPPSVVTNFPSLSKLENNTVEPSFKLVPKTAAIDPGATGAGLGAKLALFTTPPSNTTGPNPIFAAKFISAVLPAMYTPLEFAATPLARAIHL